MENIQDIVDHIRARVEAHRIADGQYARYLWQNKAGTREMGTNPYGCADAANILYTIGDFPADPIRRAAWVETMQAMQDPETGLFTESTHHTIHTTAHVIAAMELFDAVPLHPLTALLDLKKEARLETFLDHLDWYGAPWSQSHQGAGLYAALSLTGDADRDWTGRYFSWLWDNADPVTGFWRVGQTDREGTRPLYEHMAGSFHYLFNHEYARRPLRYPEAVIDSCLPMRPTMPSSFGREANFLEIDWIFCMTRAARQTPHRFEEIRDTLRAFTADYLHFWREADWETNESLNDLHMLFGGVCALAELQQFLRGELVTDKPLRLVLDRRPFI